MHEIVSQHSFVCFHFQYIHHFNFPLVFSFPLRFCLFYYTHLFYINDFCLNKSLSYVFVFSIFVCIRSFFFLSFNLLIWLLRCFCCHKSFSLLRFFFVLFRLQFPFILVCLIHIARIITIITLFVRWTINRRTCDVCWCVPQTKIFLALQLWWWGGNSKEKRNRISFFSFIRLLSQKWKPNNEPPNVFYDVYTICSAYNWTIQIYNKRKARNVWCCSVCDWI